MSLHRNITGDDNHVIVFKSYANAAARTGDTLLPADVGKVAHQTDNNTFYILTDDSPLTWLALGGAPLTNTAPVDVTKAAAAVGISTEAARQDHKHNISTAAPSTIGTANAEGSATSLARSDHVHDHGAQTVGTHHAAVTGATNGFMAASDKTKLDSLFAAVFEFVFTAGAFSTASGTPVTVNTFVTSSLPAGTYIVVATGEADVDIGDTARFFLSIDGSEVAQADITGGDSNSNDYSLYMRKITVLTAATHTLLLEMETRGGATCGVSRRQLSIARVL